MPGRSGDIPFAGERRPGRTRRRCRGRHRAPSQNACQHHVGAASGAVQCRAGDSARRDGRSDHLCRRISSSMSSLLMFLTEDCCGGKPEICAPLASVTNRCCPAAKSHAMRTQTPDLPPITSCFSAPGNSGALHYRRSDRLNKDVGGLGKICRLFRRVRSQRHGQSQYHRAAPSAGLRHLIPSALGIELE